MTAPFFKVGAFGDEASLILAVVIGIAFGFFLERAGFGNGRKLAAQFYLTDLAVFKVMFTAIVTTMLGLFYLVWIGFLDASLIYLSPTRLPSQVLGGVILGFGFVVGGYCPGTSAVAIATGKIDAMVYALGLTAGIFAFGELYPQVEAFYLAGDRGGQTLADLLHLDYGLLILAVVLIAIGGFLGAGWIERRMAARSSEV